MVANAAHLSMADVDNSLVANDAFPLPADMAQNFSMVSQCPCNPDLLPAPAMVGINLIGTQSGRDPSASAAKAGGLSASAGNIQGVVLVSHDLAEVGAFQQDLNGWDHGIA